VRRAIAADAARFLAGAARVISASATVTNMFVKNKFHAG
jgi:hypothetical protein